MRYLICIVIAFLCLASCSRPREISDDDMLKILHDLFLVNSFRDDLDIDKDSLDIYTPIFKKYGYKVEDMTFTLQEIAKKKSTRFSKVLDAAVDSLASEYNYYKAQTDVLDKIKDIAVNRYKSVAYTNDTIINIEKMSDTSKLRIEIPARKGTYNISYYYGFEPQETLRSTRGLYSLMDKDGKVVHRVNKWLTSKDSTTVKTEIEVEGNDNDNTLSIVLASYPIDKLFIKAVFDSVVVEYYLFESEALDSLTQSLLNYKLVINEAEYDKWWSQDSCTLGTNPPRLAPARDSLDRQ